jgi:transposase
MNESQLAIIEEVQSQNSQLQSENILLKNELGKLREQIEWFKRQMFGKRSEKIEPLGEQYLFDFMSKLPPSSLPQEEEKVASHMRKKPNRNGQDKIQFPDDLPVEQIYLDIPKEEKTCPDTGVALEKIGEEVSRRLACKPEQFYIKEITRPKYAYPGQPDKGIRCAPLPESFIPKGQADDSLLAHILVKKFCDHLPLYRISEIFARSSIYISRKLLSQWVIKVGTGLKLLQDALLKKVLLGKNLFIDETPVKMLAKGKTEQTFFWIVAGGDPGPDPPLRVYLPRPDRRHQNVFDILKGYQGNFHSDKFGGYESFAKQEGVTWCPCWSHIRRKFFEAGGEEVFQQSILQKIQKLFAYEEKAWELTPKERLKIRQEKEIPLIDEIIEAVKEKLMNGNLLPKSKMRQACGYLLSMVSYVKNYTLDPFSRLDNNVAERAVRPTTIGRKNWLFLGSKDGANAAGVIFSLVQTCRALKVNPEEYLKDILPRIMSYNAQKIHELLPDEWQANRIKNNMG